MVIGGKMAEKMGVRQRRAYTKKRDEERRIAVSVSIAGERLTGIRQWLAASLGHAPDVAEVRRAVSDLALAAVDQILAKK
jgi:hypothetical protein